jgi:hypothetical protein
MKEHKLPSAYTLVDIFWSKLENEYSIDVDNFVYEIISEFDFDFSEDDTDEQDEIRDEVLSILHFSGFNEKSELNQQKLFKLGRCFDYQELLSLTRQSLPQE